MAEEEEVCVLSEEITESLVLLDLQHPETPQEHIRRYNELKNGFSALLKAYQDLRSKLKATRSELASVRRNSACHSAASQADSMRSSTYLENDNLATVISMYNDRVVDMLKQVETYQSVTPAPAEEICKSTVAIQADFRTEEVGTQCEIVSSDHRVPMTESPERTFHSACSSVVIADVSDFERDMEDEMKDPNKTIQPEQVAIGTTQFGRLLLTDGAQNQNSDADEKAPLKGDYRCPICGQQFAAETSENEAVAHLMQCTADQSSASVSTAKAECPICEKTMEITNDFTQHDFEVHVQLCCEASETSNQ